MATNGFSSRPIWGFTGYRTVSREIDVPAGTHRFGLYAVAGGFDLNWWKITQIY